MKITHTTGLTGDGGRWYRAEAVCGSRYYQVREHVQGYILALLPGDADIDGESRRAVERMIRDMVEQGIGVPVLQMAADLQEALQELEQLKAQLKAVQA